MSAENPFDKGGTTAVKAPPANDFAVGAGKDAPKAAAPSGDPFALPSVPSGHKIADDINRLLIVKPTEFLPDFKTKKGSADTVRVNMVVLDGESGSPERYDDVLVFQKALVRNLKSVMDGPQALILGRLDRAADKDDGNDPAYIFATPSEEDIVGARAYLKANPL